MNTESVIASPSTTSTGPSPSMLIATSGSLRTGEAVALAAGQIDVHQLRRHLLVEQRGQHGQGRAVGLAVIQGHAHASCPLPMCGCSRMVTRLTMAGASHGPAGLGGGTRIDRAQPAQDVGSELVVGQRRLRQRQRIREIEAVDVGQAVLVAGEPRALGEFLLEHADAERHAALGLLHLLVAELRRRSPCARRRGVRAAGCARSPP